MLNGRFRCYLFINRMDLSLSHRARAHVSALLLLIYLHARNDLLNYSA